jgi:hypothetical protein
MPLYFQGVKGQSTIMSGVDLFPTTFTVAPAAILVGMAVGRWGVYRWAIWVGWVLSTLGFGLQYLLDVHTSTVAWVFITLVSGIGTGMLYPSLTFAVSAATPPKDQAYAVSLFTFFRVSTRTSFYQRRHQDTNLFFFLLGRRTSFRSRYRRNHLPEFDQARVAEIPLHRCKRQRVVERLR